jgi:hypothetical protein
VSREPCSGRPNKRSTATSLDPELLGHALFAVCDDAARLLLEQADRYPPERILKFARALLDSLALR